MNVRELIKLLKKQNPDAMVIVRGHEAGYDEVKIVEPVTIELNAHSEWYYGQHETSETGVAAVNLHCGKRDD